MPTNEISEYEKHAQGLLDAMGVTMDTVLIGSDCPMFCEDKGKPGALKYPRRNHIHGKHYQVTLSRARKSITFDYWNSYRDEENGVLGEPRTRDRAFVVRRKPRITAYDLLACLTKHDPESFDVFCSEYGYGTDSMKALETYRAVCEEWRKVSGFFTAAEVEQLREVQ
jgi:hypothetical protein